MRFSVVASFTGSQDSSNWDTSLSDAMRAAEHIAPDVNHWEELTERGESEYSYIAKESCTCEISRRRADAAQRIIGRDDFDDLDDDLKLRCNSIAWQEHDTENTDCAGTGFWDRLQDLTVSGIVDRESFENFLREIGACAEDCLTMGTLGGPLGGIAPDVSFTVEAQELIASIRVTPLPERDGELCNGMISHVDDDDERERLGSRYWEALRTATINRYRHGV